MKRNCGTETTQRLPELAGLRPRLPAPPPCPLTEPPSYVKAGGSIACVPVVEARCYWPPRVTANVTLKVVPTMSCLPFNKAAFSQVSWSEWGPLARSSHQLLVPPTPRGVRPATCSQSCHASRNHLDGQSLCGSRAILLKPSTQDLLCPPGKLKFMILLSSIIVHDDDGTAE